MENASKALIIAGAILLALLLIALGLAVFNMFDVDSVGEGMDQQAVQMFNSRWESFAARPQTAAQIRQLVNNVEAHNAGTDGVYIHLTGPAITNGSAASSNAEFNTRPERPTASVSNANRYNVIVSHDTNGRIRGMEVTSNNAD